MLIMLPRYELKCDDCGFSFYFYKKIPVNVEAMSCQIVYLEMPRNEGVLIKCKGIHKILNKYKCLCNECERDRKLKNLLK